MTEPVGLIGSGRSEIGIAYGKAEQNGRIVLTFGAHAVNWVAMDPRNAAEIAKDLIQKAAKLGVNMGEVFPPTPITEIQREVLITRVELVVRGQLERGTKLPDIARQVVDIVLKVAN